VLNEAHLNVCVQSRCQVTVVYINFRKAVDVMSHHKLFFKWHRANLVANFFLWSHTTN